MGKQRFFDGRMNYRDIGSKKTSDSLFAQKFSSLNVSVEIHFSPVFVDYSVFDLSWQVVFPSPNPISCDTTGDFEVVYNVSSDVFGLSTPQLGAKINL